ncbi:hypothetical protein LU699_13965 [Luteimonas fraxinea]|uniref:DUF1549 domain-containing protein n=1 Tax=Luteimonas fraxinea TaxID=2901869 RepID=A0ABS8UGK9_9GAMM|nr:hypothetical protein [Luteimonas fraxinea]MCD9097876.1 hypothetical protein [Luteimonas fraxinea]UHH09385.1 hypothetical protein LU699_13965 [Luteimonas fraxinea]
MAYATRSRRGRGATRLFASDTFARIASAGLTVLFGIAVLYWLPAHDARVPDKFAVAIEVVFLTPPPLPSATPAPRHAPAIADARAPTPRRATAPSRTASESSTDTTHTSPETATRLDYGALLGDAAPVAFAERLPGQRDAWRTPFEARPERFRRRRQITPEDVVRGFAQLVGLWPPGYTDSPCPAIRGLIATTPDVASPRELALLQDAVLAREQFCS